MAFTIFLSADALDDLKCVTYAPEDPATGSAKANRLLDDACSLGSLPERGRVVREFRRSDLREIHHGSNRIVYRVNAAEQTVEIVRILLIWTRYRGPDPPDLPRDWLS